MEQVWYTATAWIGLAFLASLISIRIGISVALVEIFLGFVAGNLGAHFGSAIFQPNAWINFLAGFASVVLTFLAGAEIEPEAFRRQLKPSLAIGIVSFLLPFLGAMAYAYYVSRLESPGRPDCRHRPVHHLHGGGLCGDGGDGLERNGIGKTHPGRLLHHRPGHGAGPGADLRQL